MNLKNFIEGVNIISKYYDDKEGYHLGSEHDEFYMWETDSAVSIEDKNRLAELGWMHDEGDKWMAFV